MATVIPLKRPAAEKRTMSPGRRSNTELGRTRKHLTPSEVEKLIEAAKANRYGHRDATMILVAYRHGLRALEVCSLRWDQVDLDGAVLHVHRVKKGTPATHPLTGEEMRALRKLKSKATTPFVFVSQQGSPFTVSGFRRLIERAGEDAGLEFKAHPHALRHACGYKLANDGVDTRSLQAYLGHVNIRHTVTYAELAPGRFKNFWRK